ncbi:MAG: acyl-CoA dehydrogenase family protein [Burkholderiales bacterium]|nr:acyl-CoA dehydrogenase family protein [Burkholderiales bacterium]
MNFQPSEEEALLREAASRWAAERAAAPGDPASRWSEMAAFGWLGMTLPGADGEAPALGLVEAAALVECLGPAALPDPLIPAIHEAGALIAAGEGPARARWLGGIADGSALVVPAFFDAAGAGAFRATRIGTGWRLAGTKRPVPSGARAAAWLVEAREETGAPRYFVVPRECAGVSVRAFAAIDGGEAAELVFRDARVEADAELAGLSPERVDTVRAAAVLLACAEAVGAMQAMLAATTEYTRTRTQFGKPLAANQVLRHRMADMRIALEEARALTAMAVRELSAPTSALARAALVAATRAKVAGAARRLAEEAIQLHGGMGVTDELNLGRYLRRMLALDALHGSAETHLRRLADLPGDRFAEAAARRFPELAAFRAEVRAFLEESLTPELVRAARLVTSVFPDPDIGLRWHRKLFARGWVAPAWPVEYGGTGWSYAQRWIFETESSLAGAPALSPLGLRMAGPVIMRFGTPEQKAHYLPRLLSGDDYWCQGYSEPGSGSDLASLATRAVRDGDHYVINGSKIWTTHAHHANRMFALVRTGDATVKKHEGISFLLIDMKTPGITVRPIKSASGDHEVNQVFFDDVRVPVSCRLGEEGQGWTIAKYLLEFERGGAITSGRLYTALDRVRRLVDGGDGGTPRVLTADDALAFAAVEVDIRALEATELSVMSTLAVGQNPGSVSSLLKLRWSEIHQSITRLGLRLLGPDVLAFEPERPLYLHAQGGVLDDVARPVVAAYLNARAYTIFGGTSEIQREIIAREWVG